MVMKVLLRVSRQITASEGRIKDFWVAAFQTEINLTIKTACVFTIELNVNGNHDRLNF